jgi:hypothetical protein
MLTTKDLNFELKKLNEVLRSDKLSIYEKANLKAQTLILKLLQNIRANLVKSMLHAGIDLKSSISRFDESSTGNSQQSDKTENDKTPVENKTEKKK